MNGGPNTMTSCAGPTILPSALRQEGLTQNRAECNWREVKRTNGEGNERGRLSERRKRVKEVKKKKKKDGGCKKERGGKCWTDYLWVLALELVDFTRERRLHMSTTADSVSFWLATRLSSEVSWKK